METLRIFPHDAAVFATEDDLTAWIMTALKARGGRYYLLADDPRPVPAENMMEPGSVVLFRYANNIVGEAVIRSFDKTAGTQRDGRSYQAVATFVTSSIRIYSPAISTHALQQLIGESPNISVERSYHQLDWSAYPKVLSLVTGSGCFV